MKTSDMIKEMKEIRKFLQLHPIGDFDLDEKINYIYGLSLFVNSDERLNQRIPLIGKIISVLNLPDNVINDIKQIATDFDPHLLNEIISFLINENLSFFFINDLLLLRNMIDENYDKFNESFGEFSELLAVPESTQKNFEKIHNLLKAKKWTEAYYSFAFFSYTNIKNFDHISLYYQISMDELETNYIKHKNPYFYFYSYMETDMAIMALAGVITDINAKVTLLPITISLFYNYLLKITNLEKIKSDKGEIWDSDSHLLISLPNSNMVFNDEELKDIGKLPVTGVSSIAVRKLVKQMLTDEKTVFKIISLPFVAAFEFNILITADNKLKNDYEMSMKDNSEYFKIVAKNSNFIFELNSESFSDKIDNHTTYWIAIGEQKTNI